MTKWSLLLLLFGALQFMGCRSRVNAPTRPGAVPLSAIWSGGADGGAWYDCSFLQEEPTNLCAIYSEKGALWFKARYELKGEHRAVTREEFLQPGVDYIPHATEIYLQGRKTLVAVKILYEADAEHL
jgi:hypothetical protein